MSDACMKGCGRTFKSMEAAERHEAKCNGHRLLKQGGKLYSVISDDAATVCPLCGVKAVVALTPGQIKEQPDDTTHVCHPGFKGCNHGFAVLS